MSWDAHAGRDIEKKNQKTKMDDRIMIEETRYQHTVDVVVRSMTEVGR